MVRDSESLLKIDLNKTASPLTEYGKQIEEVLRRAVREALRQHRRAGNRVAVWRDDRLMLVSAEEVLGELGSEDE